ncbi:MAG: 50S ribosomal protein L11 methyltransferase [Weeksellaceae bacterium]
MNYIQYKFSVYPKEPWTEILIAELAESAFESFEETLDDLNAYVKADLDDEEFVKETLKNLTEADITYLKYEIEPQNWNAIWESNFKPILVDDLCYIRAEFHEPKPGIKYDIVIQPKMSFGTGHHQTTKMMIEYELETDFNGKSVLDMGCGTSILGILAMKKGAAQVEGIDIDDWAVENSIENAKRNGVEIDVKLGDVALLKDKKFDIILANINKNILMTDVSEYEKSLNFAGGELILSGLMEFDFEDIKIRCEETGLKFESSKQINEWIAMKFVKN